MGASAQMRLLARAGHAPHPLDRRRYGGAIVALYYAAPGAFLRPGIYLWALGRHWRILPLPAPAYARRRVRR